MMYEIQYVEKGKVSTIPIMYVDLDEAKKDANTFMPGLEKNIVETRTKAVIFNIPSKESYANFINF
jgi:hypothetical protein